MSTRTVFFKALLPLLFIAHQAYGSFAAAKHGMVVTEQKTASNVGLTILREGGNAIDAAVAIGYALAVVNPCCGNIGGGGFMTIHLANGENIFINFREKAPEKATPKMFLDSKGNIVPNQSTEGFLAVAVPGTVLGLETALQRYGTFSRQKVMAPAIQLAEQGYRVTAFDAKWFKFYAKAFRQQKNVAAIFLKKNGQPYAMGERLVQKELADTLKEIAAKGADSFYRGDIAKNIVKASHANGGILTLADFDNYTVQILKPIYCDYRGYTIVSAPPPSSGGVTLCEMLDILEHFPLRKLGYHSAESTRIIVETMRYGFTDRNKKLGDPDFVQNPVDELLSKSYTTKLSEQIKNKPVKTPVSIPHESLQTTHYSIVDDKGNAVSVTYTLNGFFGAKVIAGKTGFFLNDEMDDFAAKPGSPNKFKLVQYDKNGILPGKRPLSSMTPTLVMKNGKVLLVLGSPGGPRIITSVMLTLLNALDYGMPVNRAVNSPRFHYQVYPDVIDVEPLAFSPLTAKQLHAMGYELAKPKSWSSVELIYIDPESKTLYGVNDYRRPEGGAMGY